MDVLNIFGLAPERDLYEILKHSTEAERLALCKTNKFKAMCKMIDFDTFSKREGTSLRGLQQFGKGAFKTILDSFPDFSSGLEFIEAVKPGFIYTDEFRQYVNEFLIIEKSKNSGGLQTTKFILGDYMYITTEKGGPVYFKEWYYKEKLHNTDGPARIGYYENGKYLEEWYNQGKLHNTNGPARIGHYKNGNKYLELWYNQGKLHNTDGPARIEYRENGNKLFEEWYNQGKHHRIDGPAFIEYYENGDVKNVKFWENGKKFK